MSQPIFPAARDAESLATFGVELYTKTFRRVLVYPYNTTVTTLVGALAGDLYGEDLEKRFPFELSYETPVLIAYLPGWKAELTKMGVDDQRPLTIAFNPDIILNAGKPLPVTGFHVLIQNERYKILQENPTDYFSNIDRTFTHTCLTQRFRPTSVTPYSGSQEIAEDVEGNKQPVRESGSNIYEP